MDMMKAIVKLNDQSNDFVLMEIPPPQIDENEILVKVKAIGVGIQDGYFFPQNMKFPYPIGIEGAGVVEKIGKKVTNHKIGDRVAFISVLETKGGTYAEYVALGKRSIVIQIPEGMSFTEAAAIPVAGNAMLKVFEALQLEPGNSIFIAGASGANGTFAIQIAKDKGCIISTSASKKNHDYMESLGAVKTVDYHEPDWVEQILQWKPEGVDAAIAIQPGTSTKSIELVKDGGKIIAVSGDNIKAQRNIEIVEFPYHMNVTEELIDLMNKIAEKEFVIFIEQIYSFEDSLEALHKVQTRRARGKSVIEVN